MNDRRRGALIGLAVGDALGAAVEFKIPGSFAPVTGYRSGGPHRLEAGEWTDDTSMALALADSIATAGWDLNDQADRYVQWWKTGKYSVNGRCFDIGITTRSALGKFVANKNALASGDPSERASGNGSIMRLAPVPIRYADLYPDKLDELSRFAEESSLPTHASEQCVSACRYLATVLAALIHGEDRDEVLSPDWKPLQQLNDIKPLHPLIQEIAQGSFRQKQPPAIQGSGWVVKSLEASLWAFHDADTFEEAVLRAVNLGDDADTTGAICGQLAGAYWGESGNPRTVAVWPGTNGHAGERPGGHPRRHQERRVNGGGNTIALPRTTWALALSLLLASTASAQHQIVCSGEAAGGYAALPRRLPAGQRRPLLRLLLRLWPRLHAQQQVAQGGLHHGGAPSDNGKTWSEPVVIMDTDQDDRDPSVACLKDGTHLLNWFTLQKNQAAVMLARSTDNGKTWGEPVKLKLDSPYSFACSAPMRQLADGSLILGLYCEDDERKVAFGATVKSATAAKPGKTSPTSARRPASSSTPKPT